MSSNYKYMEAAKNTFVKSTEEPEIVQVVLLKFIGYDDHLFLQKTTKQTIQRVRLNLNPKTTKIKLLPSHMVVQSFLIRCKFCRKVWAFHQKTYNPQKITKLRKIKAL